MLVDSIRLSYNAEQECSIIFKVELTAWVANSVLLQCHTTYVEFFILNEVPLPGALASNNLHLCASNIRILEFVIPAS